MTIITLIVVLNTINQLEISIIIQINWSKIFSKSRVSLIPGNPALFSSYTNKRLKLRKNIVVQNIVVDFDIVVQILTTTSTTSKPALFVVSWILWPCHRRLVFNKIFTIFQQLQVITWSWRFAGWQKNHKFLSAPSVFIIFCWNIWYFYLDIFSDDVGGM